MLKLVLLVSSSLIGLIFCGVFFLWDKGIPETKQSSETTPPDFRYTIDEIGAYRFRFRVTQGPLFVMELPQAPVALEEATKKGKWLILSVGVWSTNSKRSIEVAHKAVLHFRGRVILGVRPFYYYEENAKWFPPYEDQKTSPLWIVLYDGKVIEWKTGQLTEDEALLLLTKSFQDN